jgi:transcriptional regulator with XRE-family HTH domain
MSVRTHVMVAARQRARAARIETGAAIRSARMAAGLPIGTVSRAVGRSESWLSRLERGVAPSVLLEDLFVAAAAAGLRLWIRSYPGERAIADAPQLELLRRFRARVGDAWHWELEVAMPIAGDRRAADAVIRRGDVVVMVEAFTRLADAQAQMRAVHLKARDLSATRLVLVLAATRANRRSLAAARAVVLEGYPLGTRATLAALSAGRDPGANGIVLL